MTTEDYTSSASFQKDMQSLYDAFVDNHAEAEDAPLLRPFDPHNVSTEDSYFRLQYLAEGAANVLYKLEPMSSNRPVFIQPQLPAHQIVISVTGGQDQFLNRLLRICKSSAGYETGGVNFKYFQENFAPLFDHSNLVDMRPVRLDTGLMRQLNWILTLLDNDGRRPSYRKDTRHDINETCGILVENMIPSDSDESFTFEFKPKWLLQSPDAPFGATRCRNCAHWAARNADHGPDIRSTKAPQFCPIGLLSGKSSHVQRAVNYLMTFDCVPFTPSDPEYSAVAHELVEYFLPGGKGHKLLQTLANAQRRFRTSGYMLSGERTDAENDDLRKLMVLRDCSLFLRYNVPESGPCSIDAKLADFDKKGLAKLSAWQGTEMLLRNAGYYLARDRNNPFDHDCYLAVQVGSNIPRYW